MSGWEDIDGSMVMAGSPGIMGGLDIAFSRLLGSLPGQRDGRHDTINIESIERLCVKRGDLEDLRARVLAAAELVMLAKRLLCYPSGLQTPLRAAREAIDAIRVACPEYAERDAARGEYWWREVDPWGNDGSSGPCAGT